MADIRGRDQNQLSFQSSRLNTETDHELEDKTTMNSHQFQSLADARAYALAGNATITLESAKTGVHFTYKVRVSKDDDQKFFVSLLTDADNESDYNYLGLVRRGVFRLTKASKVTEDAPSAKAFRFFLESRELHPQLVVRHEGRCGRCGRTLTVPESIDAGIGPECASKIGGAL